MEFTEGVSDNWKELAEKQIDHWEPVIEISNGTKTQTGKVWIYYRNGKIFITLPVYEKERSNREIITRLTGEIG